MSLTKTQKNSLKIIKKKAEESSIKHTLKLFKRFLKEYKSQKGIKGTMRDEAMLETLFYNFIKFIKKDEGKFLEGKYFTERIPFSTKGRFIELQWVSNKEEHEF